MHSKMLIFVLLYALLAPLPNVSATLISVAEEPLSFDPVSGLYWYTNMPQLIGTYPDQASMISQINLPGYSNFHLATNQELTSLVSAVAHPSDISTFSPTSSPSNLSPPGYWWVGRGGDVSYVDPKFGPYRTFLSFNVDPVSNTVSSRYWDVADWANVVQAPDLAVSTWVAGNADPVPAPEPSSLALLAVGLITGSFLMRKWNRR